jgi:hypothetical protein
MRIVEPFMYGSSPPGSGLGLYPEDVSYSISLAVACVKDGAIVCTHTVSLHPMTDFCDCAFNRPALAEIVQHPLDRLMLWRNAVVG